MGATENHSEQDDSEPTPPKKLRGRNEKHEAWILRKLWDRLNVRNEHMMGCIVGREGSGKSWTAIRIADEIDQNFTADNVIFDVSELLRILKEGEHSQGDVYVLDEAGVSFGVRTWQDRAQILANQALQLIRDHNIGLVFTLPRGKELDSQTKGRLQWYYEIIEKNTRDGYVAGKYKWLDPDRSMQGGEVYEKYPRRYENGWLKRIKSMRFRPPRQEVIDPYQERKDQFQEETYQETIDKLNDESEDEGSDKPETVDEIIETIDESVLENIVGEDGRSGEPIIKKGLIYREFENASHAKAAIIRDDLREQYDSEELAQYV